MAGWQSGYAAACKAVYAGSIPTPAFWNCVELFGALIIKKVERPLKTQFELFYDAPSIARVAK